MMDLRTELRKRDKVSSMKSCIEELKKEQEELNKKTHIIKVLALAQGLYEIAHSDLLNNQGVSGIRLENHLDQYNDRTGISFDLLDINRKKMNIVFTGKTVGNIHSEILEIFKSTLRFVPLGYLNEKFESNTYEEIIFNKDIKERVIDLCLSSELKTILKYNELNLDLIHNEQNNNKKLKL
jgi:hypothetical protein